jgi:hypothetical protein
VTPPRGRATIVTAALHDADQGGSRFDTMFALPLPLLLRGRPKRELPAIRARPHPAASNRLHVKVVAPAPVATSKLRVWSASAHDPHPDAIGQRGHQARAVKLRPFASHAGAGLVDERLDAVEDAVEAEGELLRFVET